MNVLALYESQTINKTYNNENIIITRPQDIYELNQIKDIKNKVQEHLIVISLNNKNVIDSIELVGIGSSNCITVDVTDVLRCAIIRGSNGIIVAHNHPSGENTPSKNDIKFTNRLNSMAKIFNIKLLDHIVIGDKNLRMKEQNYICNTYDSCKLENETIKELKEQNSKLMHKIEKLENRLERSHTNSRSNLTHQDEELEL